MQNLESQLDIAFDLLARGDLCQALGRFRCMSGRRPPVESHYGAGLCLILLNRMDEGLLEFLRGYRRDEVVRGGLLPVRQMEQALEYLERWLGFFPSEPLAWTVCGSLHLWLGRAQAAADCCEKAMECSSPAVVAVRRLTEDIERRHPSLSRRLTEFSRFVLLEPPLPSLYRDLLREARRLVGLGHWEGAEVALRLLRGENPRSLDVAELLVDLYRATGQDMELKKELGNLMDLYEQAGLTREARETGAALFELWPEDPAVLVKQVLFLHRSGDQVNLGETGLRLVDRLVESGEPEAAASWLRWLLKKPLDGPARADSELLLAEIDAAAGRLREALARLHIHVAQAEFEALGGRRPEFSHLRRCFLLMDGLDRGCGEPWLHRSLNRLRERLRELA